MHKWPPVTDESLGEVTRTISLSCTRSVSVHPTPQYGQIVSVTVCFDSSHFPLSRRSCSLLNISAPVGQTPTQLPQNTHAESGSEVSCSVEMRASNPRPATPIA